MSLNIMNNAIHIHEYFKKKYTNKWLEYINYKIYIYISRSKEIYENRLFLKYLSKIYANKNILCNKTIETILTWFTAEDMTKSLFEPIHLTEIQQEYMKPYIQTIIEAEELLSNSPSIQSTTPYIRTINKSLPITIAPNILEKHIFLEVIIFLEVSDDVVYITEDTIIDFFKGCYYLHISSCNPYKYSYIKNKNFNKKKHIELVYGFYIPFEYYLYHNVDTNYTLLTNLQAFETMKGRYYKELSIQSNNSLSKLISMNQYKYDWCIKNIESPISKTIHIENVDIELLTRDCKVIEQYDPNISYYFNSIIWFDNNIDILNTELIQKYHIINIEYLNKINKNTTSNTNTYVLDNIAYIKLLYGSVYRHAPDYKNNIIFTYVLDVHNDCYIYYEGAKNKINKGDIIITNSNNELGIFRNEYTTICLLQYYYTI